MKKPKLHVSLDEPLPYGFRDLVLFPTLLTLGTSLIALAVALIQGGRDIFTIAGAMVLALAVIFFVVTFLVGGLGLVPTVVRRMFRRLTRTHSRGLEPDQGLFDHWVDGP